MSTIYNIHAYSNSSTHAGFKPPHHCKLPQNASSLEDWVPRGESGQLSSCTMYSNLSTPNFTTSCSHGWVFNYSISGATIATKVSSLHWIFCCLSFGNCMSCKNFVLKGLMVFHLLICKNSTLSSCSYPQQLNIYE